MPAKPSGIIAKYARMWPREVFYRLVPINGKKQKLAKGKKQKLAKWTCPHF